MKKNDNLYDCGMFSPDAGIIYNIDRAKRVHQDLQNKICDLQYQDCLVTKDIAEQLQSLHYYYVLFGEGMFHKIWYYATGHEKEEDDKDFDVKVCLNMLKEKIFDKEHIDNAEFIRITMYNYGEAYRLEYEIYGQIVTFTFPMYEKATDTNWYSLYYSAHYYESEYCLDLIASDLKRDVVFEKFNKWLTKKKKKVVK